MSQMPIRPLAGLRLTLCALVLGLGACAQKDPPDGPPPTALAKADSIITGLQPSPRGVRVLARIDAPDVAGDIVHASSIAIRQIARAVQHGARDLPPEAKVITFDLYGTDVDKFGKRSFGRMFETDFYIQDMRNLDLKTKGPAAVMNTAIDLRIDKAGTDPINAWCMRYPHVAGNWCSMAGN
jgi:hypothetical protein